MSARDPDVCHVCGRQAVGIATGKDRWLCAECVPLLEFVKNVRRPSPYELKAREGGMEAAAPLVEEYGNDLSEWTEEQVLQFVGACWRGTADRIRWLIKNDEAMW
jgi:hypothetical protein